MIIGRLKLKIPRPSNHKQSFKLEGAESWLNSKIFEVDWCFTLSASEAYSEVCQTSKMDFFKKVVNSFLAANFPRKKSILGVLQGYVSAHSTALFIKTTLQWYFEEPLKKFLGTYAISHPAFTCSKSTIETTEQCVKSVQS